MRLTIVLGLLLFAIMVPGTAQASVSGGGGGDEPCQDPRISGAFCAVCWEFLDPLELQDVGPWNAPKWKCATTEAPN